MTTAQQTEQAQAIEQLRGRLKPGDTLFTILRKCAPSGMTRSISVIIPSADEGIEDITWLVGRVLGLRCNNDGGLKVSGAGMDMGFHLVYSLSSRLFPDGFTLAPGQRGRNGDRSGLDRDGGYALAQRWL